MAIKSTKKVLASILSFAMISQSFCGAKDFIENKNIPQKSIVIKKEKPTVFNKIKEFAKKHPVKAAACGVAAATPVLIGLGLAINYLVSGHGKVIDVKRDELYEDDYQLIEKLDKDDKANALTMEDVDDYVKGNHDKFVIYEDGTLEILDENITKIGPFAFYKTNITKIKIPNSVGKIGVGAFEGCTSLNSVIIPNSVEKIGAGAFQSCKKLGEVKFEEKSQLKEIGVCAFAGCTSLNSVTIPSGCKYFDNSFPEEEGCVVTKINSTN